MMGRRAPLTLALSPPRGEGGEALPCFSYGLAIRGSIRIEEIALGRMA